MATLEQAKSGSAPIHRSTSTKTVLVTGARGLLGGAVCAQLESAGHRVIRHARSFPTEQGSSAQVEFPLEQLELIEPVVRRHQPDWIVHTAANVNLDDCERCPAAARRLHVEASAELAKAAQIHGSRLLYVSTDSVYDGERIGAHDETSEIRPLNVYAETKWQGEQACLENLPSTVVARVNFVGLSSHHERGLAAWLIRELSAGRRVPGFVDVIFSPLAHAPLAGLFVAAMRANLGGGIYNFAAVDSCSKFDFARRMARLQQADPDLVYPATLAEARLFTARPRNTAMSGKKIAEAIGCFLPTVDEGLKALLVAENSVARAA